MKKYRLKKDIVLPDLIIPAGTISRNIGERCKGVWYHEFGYKGDVMGYSQQIIERYPEWFEEVNDESRFAKAAGMFMDFTREMKVTCEPMSPNMVTTFRVGNTEFTVKNVASPKETQKQEDACFTLDDLKEAFEAAHKKVQVRGKAWDEELRYLNFEEYWEKKNSKGGQI